MMREAIHSNSSLAAAKPQRGFTLVELLVVIGIISLLAGLLVPTVSAAWAKANKTACVSNLKQMGNLCELYAQDHHGYYPIGKGESPPAYRSLQALLDSDDSIKPKMFICPAADDEPAETVGDQPAVLAEKNVSYAWTAKKLKNSTDANVALASDDSIINKPKKISENHKNGMNVLFCDKRVEWVLREDLPEGLPLPEGLVDSSGK